MTSTPGPMIAVFSVIRSALLWIGAAIGTLCLILFLLGVAFGIRPQAVVSGSMEPTLPTGSLILVKPEPVVDVRAGDIVTAALPDGRGTVTHRVVALDKDRNGVTSLTLKGDANLADDPVPYPVATVGKHLATIPGLGTLALAFRTPAGLAAVALVTVVFLAVVLLPGRKARRRPDRAHR
ncbi:MULTISPECIES: signal peptidase I [Arthrobacter]|uniref:Signal peptidase I n=2 Tax=Arthrobacter TaxID=1663 RepID=A0ABU9KT12_9MICC|nr:signal peptidase I [Arthrobacter sp. YJM1]MDP5228627.1 signal peptidase I [Arthrobacter sp. YJM1]